MPTYDYLCKTCGHRFEYFQSISSDALTHCPEAECILTEPEEKGKGEVQRLVSGGAGLVFKGGGFYLTDYVRKGGEGKKAAEPKGGKESGAGKSESKGGGESKGKASSGGTKNTGSGNST